MTDSSNISNDSLIYEAKSFESRVSDSLVLRGEAWGNSKDRPVIFAHGGGQTHHAWGASAQHLAQNGWYAVAIDMRGHGDSDWAGSKDYAPHAFAQDLLNLAKSFEQKPVVVGASLGGLSALLAETIQEESGQSEAAFSAVVLVDVTPRMEASGVSRILDFMAAKAEQGFTSLEEAGDSIAEYLPNRPRPKSLAGLSKNLRLHDDGRYRWHWDPAFIASNVGDKSMGLVDELEDAAKKLQEPVLLVRGRMSDLVTEASAQAFLDLVPQAQYADIHGAGHMVAGDDNDVFSDAISEFLAPLK